VYLELEELQELRQIKANVLYAVYSLEVCHECGCVTECYSKGQEKVSDSPLEYVTVWLCENCRPRRRKKLKE